LARVGDLMTAARAPWWVIGSAAVALHGGETDVGDVDVLLSVHDAAAIAARLGLTATMGSAHPLFRSERFFAWTEPPVAVEFMAGFAVRDARGWSPVEPVTRDRMAVGAHAIFVPARDELRAMLRRFGRPKDRARAALLTG
jgi:hypothetical protein